MSQVCQQILFFRKKKVMLEKHPLLSYNSNSTGHQYCYLLNPITLAWCWWLRPEHLTPATHPLAHGHQPRFPQTASPQRLFHSPRSEWWLPLPHCAGRSLLHRPRKGESLQEKGTTNHINYFRETTGVRNDDRSLNLIRKRGNCEQF